MKLASSADFAAANFLRHMKRHDDCIWTLDYSRDEEQPGKRSRNANMKSGSDFICTSNSAVQKKPLARAVEIDCGELNAVRAPQLAKWPKRGNGTLELPCTAWIQEEECWKE